MGLGKMKNRDSQDLTDLRFKPKEKSVPSWQSVFLHRPKAQESLKYIIWRLSQNFMPFMIFMVNFSLVLAW
jgi:hypothetical protein